MKTSKISSMSFWFILTFVLTEVSFASLQDDSWMKKPPITTVHLVPHSHDDLGWLQSIDGYFYKVKDAFEPSQFGGVYYIITSVIDALLDNPDRRFTQAEMKFFAMWWHKQNERKKEQVRELIRNGQLELVNGGWSMHDEACPTYSEMINNMVLGH